jgi:hypothetical protein
VISARIIVDAKTFHVGNMGPATGNICLSLGSSAFPSQSWNDFVVVVLEAWVSALTRLLSGISEHEFVHFMEGPFAVEMIPSRQDTVRLRAITNGRSEVACVDTEVLSLAEDLIRGSEQILAACRNQQYWTADSEKLSASLPALRKQILA